MEISANDLEITGTGMPNYSGLVQNFSKDSIENLQKRFPHALQILITNENGEQMFTNPRFIFDCEDWRFYIHRCLTEDGLDEVITVLVYNANFSAMPITLQMNEVCLLLEQISNGLLGKGKLIRSCPGHVAMMFAMGEFDEEKIDQDD